MVVLLSEAALRPAMVTDRTNLTRLLLRLKMPPVERPSADTQDLHLLFPPRTRRSVVLCHNLDKRLHSLHLQSR